GGAHGGSVVAHGLEHGFDPAPERRDRRLDGGATLVLCDDAVALLVLAAPLGDVLVGRHPAAARDWAVRDRDHAAFDFDYVVEDAALGDAPLGGSDVVVDILRERAGHAAILEQLAQRNARIGLLAGEAIHLQIALVADDEPRRAVEHAQTLGHVVERR